MFRNWGTGAYSLVSLLIIIAVPTPQLGWQPHLTYPQSAPGPWTRSAKSAKAPIRVSDNQSRVGSAIPTWHFTSFARFDHLYRWRRPRSGDVSCSRPVNQAGWNSISEIS